MDSKDPENDADRLMRGKGLQTAGTLSEGLFVGRVGNRGYGATSLPLHLQQRRFALTITTREAVLQLFDNAKARGRPAHIYARRPEY